MFDGLVMRFDITSMLKPAVYDHPVNKIELIETHISWVLLTGDFAYKIKKPVNFGFLDFSTLEKRHTFCVNELFLNRRLAAAIYLEVVSISGTQNKPVINGRGKAFEYAVKMAQFPQSAQLDHMLAAGQLNAEHMDVIAHMVADFHGLIDVANDSTDYGDNNTIYRRVDENFKQIRQHLDIAPYADTLATLQQWSRSAFETLGSVFERRKADGFVRECHGDMHLRNLIWLDNRPMAFDCIEFNASLRWIDVMSEAAFLVMDLQSRRQYELANCFLNSYLELTGDYAGLAVLPFYLCYRALVRAKVDTLRFEQKALIDREKEQLRIELESYLHLATGYIQPSAPRLIIMHGLSASGKSTVSGKLLEKIGAIRIRSDVERKRLFDIELADSAASKIDSGIYSKHSSQKTYAKLVELASVVISAGYSVIIDAAFLKREQRQFFESLAKHLGVSYIILETTAPTELLRQRVAEKRHDVSDADIAVLEHQISNRQPLYEDETALAISVNTGKPLKIDILIGEINAYSLEQG